MLYAQLICLILIYFIKFSSAGLYSSEDNTEILDAHNFYEKVLNKENAWLIQFYNSWCGHCRNFAPKWKSFGRDVLSWKETVTIGAIDCSVDENAEICREYEVAHYPMIKLFGAHIQVAGKGGKEIDQMPIEDIKKIVIQFITNQQSKGKGSTAWANLQPYNGTISTIWNIAPMSVVASVVITENRGSLEGRNVILDLQIHKEIYVRRKVSMNMKRSEVVVDILLRNGKKKQIKSTAIRSEMRKLILRSIGKYTGISAKDIPEDSPALKNPNEKIASIPSSSLYPKLASPSSYARSDTNVVYMVDIENMLSYMFRHEVSLHKTISGDELDALRSFTEVLYMHLPARPQIHSMIGNLFQYFLTKSEVHGKDIASVIDTFTSDDTFLPKQKEWMGCLGSQPRYRGYPCSLWVTFHTLTVNASLTHTNNPLTVLQGIRGYVKYFFGCSHCSKHFQQMYKDDAAEEFVTNADDAVTWLWKSHNKVNNRLKNDTTEDPHHKKISFPSVQSCPRCWDNAEEFNEENTLAYVKKLYNKDSLSQAGVQKLTQSQKVFKDSEIRTCIILYFVFTIILLAFYYLFCVKFRLKKKATGIHIL